jgi:uncharacterized protein (DUF1810 family)
MARNRNLDPPKATTVMPDNRLSDPYDLQRFIEAQRGVFQQVQAELRAGCKQGHWMWFIFPQIRGLGHSQQARIFAISSLTEATAYVDDPVLGSRLRECTRLVNLVDGKPIEAILGHPDELKFQSSMTLFARATPDNQVFLDALKKYCRGEFDRSTLDRL